jgi:uncharacterized protein YbjT (DUF2867 family)
MNKQLHAIVLGATGLVGSSLIKELLEHKSFNKVSIITRRETGFIHPKIEEHIIDFETPYLWNNLIHGDVLFSAFGTTIKKAGSKDMQYKIDYTYQANIAIAAAKNHVTKYVLVSSAGANPKSKIFYSRMKGELDEKVKSLGFESLHLIKPSVLAGSRNEIRTGERLGIMIGYVVCKIPFLKKYRPISDTTVAKAMINCAINPAQGIFTHELEDVHKLTE